jgi:hypothetical protein
VLHIQSSLAGRVVVPPAVVDELAAGRALGLNLPDPAELGWVVVRRPASMVALRLVTDLGPGESEALALALEAPESLVVLDDALARQVAEMLGIRYTGTLGLLIDAKRARLLPTIGSMLDQLQALGFRLAPHTRAAVLRLAGESS